MTCAHCGTDENVRTRRAMPYGPIHEDTDLCTDCYHDVIGIFPERKKP